MYPDKNLTFKVDASRAGQKLSCGTPMQINRDLGEAILEAFPQMKVDVHTIRMWLLDVEVRQKVNHVTPWIIPGPGRHAGGNQRKGHAASLRRH